jgi:hypothetical protein
MYGDELKRLADLNYLARLDYGITTEPLKSNMVAFSQALASRDNDTVRNYVNANRATVPTYLGYMAGTTHGQYWKGVVEYDKNIFARFSEEFGVPVLNVAPPGTVTPPTPPAPAPVPPPSGTAIRETRSVVGQSEVYVDGKFDIPLADCDVRARPQAFLAECGFGGPPIRGVMAAIRKGGQIVFSMLAREANTQEKNGDRDRLGTILYEPYDNGFRFVQNGAWIGGKLQRVASHVRILAMDSAGTVSKSDEDYSGERVERGQLWIIREDFVNKKIIVTACRAGWGVESAASTQTFNDHNPNPGDRVATHIAPIPGEPREIRAEDYGR